MAENQFKFEISLSVLNHLGRNLYRNFITVLGEGISNSWDADAKNVWIYIDKDNNNFVIKDDGVGMDASDFQNKFLKVGYRKRKNGEVQSPLGRPYIGAKGIGKLALLSCAKTISVISKTKNTEYIGGVIDNTELDKAIQQEMSADQYPLGFVDYGVFASYLQGHDTGTIIYFQQVKENIGGLIPYIKKLLALYFRFSLLDETFNIFLNGEPVSIDDVKELAASTEFLWNINEFKDPYIDSVMAGEGHQLVSISNALEISGFIATVEFPKNLKVTGTEEKVGVDLFVNGRLREKDLLKHIPTAQVPESYLYGQIHFDELDGDGEDRFTSSREGVIACDEKYQSLLRELKVIIFQVLDKWDELRLLRDKDGDDDNPRKSKKARKARSLYNLSSEDYKNGENGDQIKNWISTLQPDAEFNIPAYVDCYLSENLLRKFIVEKKVPLTSPAVTEIDTWKKLEARRKSDANISFDIRGNDDDLGYLGMDFLAKVVDSGSGQQGLFSFVKDATEFKPMRNAVGHTSLLTDLAKERLTLVFENIKAKVKSLLSS